MRERELFAARVARFDEAVGIEHDRVAAAQRNALLLEAVRPLYPEYEARRRQFLDLVAVRPVDQRRIVSGVDNGQ